MPLAAIAQLRSTSSPTENLTACLTLIQQASAAGATILFLPEASDYIAPSSSASLSLATPLATSPFILGLQEAARQHSIAICVGVHAPNADGTRVQNLHIYINSDGDITQSYQKLHLFDVNIASGPQLQESASVEPGSAFCDPFSSPVGKLGLLICFDLRFPEASLALRARGAQILTYPSAFTVPTGRAHWEVLLRARAVENQCWVVAAAQVGQHDEEGKRRSYGHAMVVDPWGRVVVDLGEEEGVIGVFEVELGGLEKVRREVPLCRRTDVYAEVK
ncbi:carbon-nitrogen hydrolase [Sporormia fimetaria CBS 119925]|uniref:Carbon-nitrogen hydrolase n=1 Tax=Sporormia fimetaria CBS 119925 TaxID=1340428 RepID=A0A6A6VBD6_9PLEO|nr:carbon-nitrogen hydrolase [Sporormia fimetaria CBS 119925]